MQDRTEQAREFALSWLNRGSEKGEAQTFWLELLHDVLGVESPADFIEFEKTVALSHKSYIDAYIPSTKILIEQKGLNVDLTKAAIQSDGTLLTPFEQAKRYKDWLPASEQGRWIITCNFREFRVHDLEFPRDEPEIILLKDLESEWQKLLILVNTHAKTPKEIREQKLSEEAGDLIRKFYNCIKPRYKDKNSEISKRNLNILCTRLVFLLYAEDSGIFAKNAFHDFLTSRKNTARTSLLELFAVLNQEEDERDPYLEDDLKAFRFINGGLFEQENIEIPKIDGEPLRIILEDMSESFNWSSISPTIFGAIFESTLNDDTRRFGGMHYTMPENIHKVINPLFMNELNHELDEILADVRKTSRVKKLIALQDKLSRLTFLDPACGSGNFLTETFIMLRRLENKIIAELSKSQKTVAEGSLTPIKVSISQFYGIEINDFAVNVARTALYIAEHQMRKETEAIIDIKDEYLPLQHYANIIRENAVTYHWEDLIKPESLNYIISNPPFRGARIMTPEQKRELSTLFTNWKAAGNIDYIACWYVKAFHFMKGSGVRAAFVSTNSINQGDNVSVLWKDLFDGGLNINFAYKTFIWDNKTLEEKAHVHCVIIGFNVGEPDSPKHIYDVSDEGTVIDTPVNNINAYLVDAPNVFVINISKPLFDVPLMRIGNKPIDDGNYLFTPSEFLEFTRRVPLSMKYFHLWYGGEEFIHNTPRYCLYLGNCTPHELKRMPECLKRVEAVRAYRLASESIPTRKLADTPTRFHVETFPKGDYIVIPKTSSGKREYIPMGFLDESVMCADSLRIIPEGTLYHFGVLESLPHMGWVRRITGRLKSDYSYSIGIDYNPYIWPSPTDEQRARIESTAQMILDARALYPDSNLDELYTDAIMPLELRRAHRLNDEAVCEAYGFDLKSMSEFEIVNELMRLYHEITVN
ncbi:MAG: SAM-dependent DNA methyltransferase [Synergistaceae bacterium]|nr:SAM-dependent DNA methyltransferase [Synergistaceae bacterium]